MCRAHERAADRNGPHGLPIYFADKVAFAGEDECWLWLRHVNAATGYGQVSWLGKRHGAHRVVYEILIGDIPAGLHIDHLCRVRACVNPRHLEPVTQAENNRRGLLIGPKAPRTGCKHGHDWAEFPPGIVHRSDGTVTRYCAECPRERRRLARAA